MTKSFLRLGALALCFGTVAMADPFCSAGGGYQILNQVVTNGQVFTGTGLFTGSDGCTIGGLDFSNWQIRPNTGYAGAGANLNITVGVDGTGALSIASNMSVAAGDDVEIEFSVTNGTLSDFLSVGGGGGVNEIVCSNQMAISVGSCAAVGGTTLGSGSVGGPTSSTLINLTAAGTDWVFKDISGASEVSQQFIPEPMTLSLMGVGLLGLGLIGRRLRK